MSIQTQFFNWATSGLPWAQAPWEQCSPNLVQLLRFLRETWGGYSLGCEGDRTIREGTAISSHAYGAALDWRWNDGGGVWPAGAGAQLERPEAEKLLRWVIDNSRELHVDAIHDYSGDRIWRAGRTNNTADAHGSWWRKQNGAGSGMGEAWATYFHFETTRNGWGNAAPIAARAGIVLPGAPPPPGLIKDAPPPSLRQGQAINEDTRHRTRWLQQILNERFGGMLAVDGIFGGATAERVVFMQSQLGIVADGVYGPQTANALAAWLDAH